MTTEEMRIALAVDQGWKIVQREGGMFNNLVGIYGPTRGYQLLPELTLDWMNKIERAMDEETLYRYYYHFLQPMFHGSCSSMSAAIAIKEQRAEAILKMKNLWKLKHQDG